MNCPHECPQGMVLEIDPYDMTGETPGLPTVPVMRYRCQDCGLELDVLVAPKEEVGIFLRWLALITFVVGVFTGWVIYSGA